MSSKATIRQIAKLANVSIATVDRVLHNRGYVSSLTRELIEKIMLDLDYIPNTYARNLSLNKTFKIAVLLPASKDGDYWSYPLLGAKKAIKDFKMFGIQMNPYFYNQNKKKSFLSVSKKVFNDSNDAVIFSTLLHKESAVFIKECNTRKIPFVLLGSNEIGNGALVNIGQNSFHGGRLSAELLDISNKKSNRNYLIINLLKANNPNYRIIDRINGFKSYFTKLKNRQVSIETITINDDDLNLIKIVKSKINTTNELQGIFIPNSKSHLIEKAFPKDQTIPIIGYDLLEKNKDLMKLGKLHFLINQQPVEQAYKGIEILYKYLVLKESPNELIDIQLDIVTREKLMYYK